jgi:hypothetical protein
MTSKKKTPKKSSKKPSKKKKLKLKIPKEAVEFTKQKLAPIPKPVSDTIGEITKKIDLNHEEVGRQFGKPIPQIEPEKKVWTPPRPPMGKIVVVADSGIDALIGVLLLAGGLCMGFAGYGIVQQILAR